jgi:hypothetical protein
MDTKDGRIYSPEEVEELRKRAVVLHDEEADKLLQRLVPVEAPTDAQMKRFPPAVKGWERCPCGSGKLFKNCHKRKAPE